ncbi:MAG: ABC transporter substrate-binding protein [Pseudomonadota bacterium]
MGGTGSERAFGRRRMLTGGVAALAAPLVLPGAAAGQATRHAQRAITLGFAVPLTGAYAAEGADEADALALALDHLNGEGRDAGMLATFRYADGTPTVLTGDGVLGRRVAALTSDTATNASVARDAAAGLIRDGASMVTGGASSGSALAMQAVCDTAGVIFMTGLTHSNEVTGARRARHGFRHFFNAHMSAQALAPALVDSLGANRRAYYLTANYSWGWSAEASMRAATEALGWETVAARTTPLGRHDFSEYIAPFFFTEADVLILSHYGGDMQVSLAQAMAYRLREREVNGRRVEIVVPLWSRLAAGAAGEAAEGILGAVNWHWSLRDAGSRAFTASFETAYGRKPTQAAHTCYTQVLLWADAVERAGTLDPCGLIEALEDFRFDGLGVGPSFYRGADHQCFKDVVVARGQREGEPLVIDAITDAADVTYAPDHPSFAAAPLGGCDRRS